jgi:hypothetical protein
MSRENYKARIQHMLEREEEHLIWLKRTKTGIDLIAMSEERIGYLKKQLQDYKNENMYSKVDQTYFYSMPEFVPASWLENYIVDVAEDNQHPGIESNKIVANTLIKYIEAIYERRY